MSRVGVSDRTKLEEFFESVRSLENKLELQLERPEPLPACSMPDELTGTEFKSTVLGHAIKCACAVCQVTNPRARMWPDAGL